MIAKMLICWSCKICSAVTRLSGDPEERNIMYATFSEMLYDTGSEFIVKFLANVSHVASTHQTGTLPILVTFPVSLV